MSVVANKDGTAFVQRGQDSAAALRPNPWPQVRGWIVRHDRAELAAALAHLHWLAEGCSSWSPREVAV